MERPDAQAAGGCLCGSVRYEIDGELMPVINCHCSKCRRFHGHVGAYAATRREHLVLVEDTGLATERHVYVSQKTDCCAITDELPCHAGRFAGDQSGKKQPQG